LQKYLGKVAELVYIARLLYFNACQNMPHGQSTSHAKDKVQL